jgi:putative DNA primase/helicase
VKGFLDPSTFKPAARKDELPLFMPAEYAGAGSRRLAANVLRVHFLVFDVDTGTWEELKPALSRVQKYGHIVYTSFSHEPKGQLKIRILVKLDRPVEITEWSRFWIRAVHYFGLQNHSDRKCADACHMYYVPGGERARYQVQAKDGPGVNVDEVLATELPMGESEPGIPHYQEVLNEEDRGEISQSLKDIWDGKLQNLAHEIETRPYPGSIYDLKSHGVFGIARGIPHLISSERVRNVVRNALNRRYNKHGGDAVEAHRQKSLGQVDKAIEQGEGKPWYPPKVDDLQAFPLTELGLAERLLAGHNEDLAWEPSWAQWLVWNEKFWNLEAGSELAQRRMKQTVRTIPDEANAHHAEHWEAQEALEAVKDDPDVDAAVKDKLQFQEELLRKRIEAIHKFALACETNGKITSGIKLATDDASVLTCNDEFNRDPWLLNFNNGTLDLRTGTLREHNRNDMITRMVPYPFDAGATCPTFDKFLFDCMLGRKRLIDFIWRLLGYSAVGLTTEQILILCIGEGANGKSTFMNVILDAFGQGDGGFAFAANSENLLTTKGGSRHETWRMSLFGKRIVACQEVEEGRNFNESLIKELTGSDVITGRKMRQNEWSFDPVHQLWLCANHLPHVRGTDEGIWRRLQVIPWEASFKQNPDRKLPEKLRREIPGIWARIAREAVAWREHGLFVPREVVVATAHYRRDQDPLRPFLEAWCKTGGEETFAARDLLWAAYLEHTEDAKSQVFNDKKKFYAAVEKRFRQTKRTGVRGFRGVRLLTPQERMEASPRAKLMKAEGGTSDVPDPKNEFN